MKIEYQKTTGLHGEAVYIPMVPFQFRKAGGGTVGGYALVDSGATRSFFDAKYATGIGIEDVESLGRTTVASPIAAMATPIA